GDVTGSGDLDHRGQLIRVVAAILSVEIGKLRGKKAGSLPRGEQIDQILRSLSVDELLALSIDDLAKKCGCSRRHLARLFQKQCGVSVSGLKMEMRMLRAVSLLRDPSAKIISIAEGCG